MKKFISARIHKWFVLGTVAILFSHTGLGKKPIRTDFFNTYPSAAGTVLDDVASNEGHCGVCHLDFNGGGARNLYGQDVETERASNGGDSVAAFLAIESDDSDGDGYTNIEEITNSPPTFAGLSSDDLASVANVDSSDIIGSLTPSGGGGPDITDPVVDVLSPDGGETTIGNSPFTISWSATDNVGIAYINIYVSLDNGFSYKPIALGLPNSPSNFAWFVSNRPTSNALIKVEAYDTSLNEGEDTSAAVFSVISTNDFPTTLRDFDQPGSQPIVDSGTAQVDPSECATCHGNYSEAHEPYRNWLGSMMAHASYDPIFLANLAIAQQDAPDSGDLCLRCHNSRGWLDGRSTPTDGSQMTADDLIGVSCNLCHRLVDPHYEAGVSPIEDYDIIDSLELVPSSEQGNGMYVFDPSAQRRGPYDDALEQHSILYSPYHRESALCGTCHNVSNPAFERGTNVEYQANSFDAPATNFSPEILMPVERTFSEWLHSDYNTTNGIFAPQFAGVKDGGMVASCQDCHMPDTAGYGANTNLHPTTPYREDLPLHDMTGGSSWLIRILPSMTNFPYAEGTAEAAAMTNGALRAEYMLQKAARMYAEPAGDQLRVRVVNDTGHKLPTGYPEGRRIWINVRFYDSSSNVVEELGAYNYSNAVLTVTNTTVYEVHPGIGTNLAATLNSLAGTNAYAPGPSFHFVLNNQVYEDNRIPPRGFSNAAFESFGGQPVGHHYDDGQYWDDVFYAMPSNAVRAHVRLFYQSTSKEFIEFLRDENTTTDDGQFMYDLWVANDKCPPVLMTEAFWPEDFTMHAPSWLAGNVLEIPFNSISGYTYWIEYADQLGSNVVWTPFMGNYGMLEAIGSESVYTDDFTTATSGSDPTNAHRFYRIWR